MTRFFWIFGGLVLALFTYADYRGLSLARYNELKNVPKSIRENPGTYRSMYTRFFHK